MNSHKIKSALFILLFGNAAYSQSITNGVFMGDLTLQPKTTAPTQPGNFHVSGNLVDFGTSLVGSVPYPSIVFNYTDDTTGSTSNLTLDSYRAASTWNWRQGSGANRKLKMSLDNNNKLSLYDFAGVSKISTLPPAHKPTRPAAPTTARGV